MASDIIDTENGNVSYKKKKTDSLTDPYYFNLHLPPKETRGILCLQQSGIGGVKSLLDNILTGQFKLLYPDHRLHIRQLTISDALANYLKDGVVEEITVEKHEIPADIAD